MAQFSLDGKRFDLMDLFDDKVQCVLAKNHSRNRCRCLCNDIEPRELIIFKRGERYYLKSMPGDGDFHSGYCRFGKSSTGTQAGVAFTVDDEGEIKASLDIKLKDTKKTQRPDNTVGTDNKPLPNSSNTRRKTSLLGLLRSLWHTYSLEYYNPDHEHTYANLISRRFFRAIKSMRINRYSADKVIYLTNPTFSASASSVNKNVSVERPIIIGLLDGIDETGTQTGIKIQGLSKIFATTEQIEQYKVFCNHRAAWQVGGIRPGYDIVICQCELIRWKKGYYLSLIDDQLQSMAVTDHFVEFQSSYEKQFAECLTDQGRRFKKPIQEMDSVRMVPDFVLIDTTPWVYVEVWGRANDPVYQERKQQKRALYQKEQYRLLEWDAAIEEMPLPPDA